VRGGAKGAKTCAPSLARPRRAQAVAGEGCGWRDARRLLSSSAPKEVSAAGARATGVWLLGTAGAVFGMIVLGGATRLTRSGLSMVDWSPMGRPLPSTTAEWEAEFAKYKEFPEYKLRNVGMSLEDFKFIYFMEWFHRMWGRGLGVVFAVPGAALLAAGAIPPPLYGAIGASFALGGAQGLVGWWMVKSGLVARAPGDVRDVRVSAYRLTAHFATALTIYSVLVWSGLEAFRIAAQRAKAQAPADSAAVSAARANAFRALRGPSHAALALIGLTALSGGFVAGNDAGRAFNDWPFFAGKLVPDGIWNSSLGWRNFFENTALVQFDHRELAYSSLAAVAYTLYKWRPHRPHLPPAINRGAALLGLAAVGQVSLGIATLMTYVPVSLGVTHQGGAIVLWTAALAFRHALRAIRP
jgi:cytochrome c oxidase assembly protein subunit 15